MQLARGIGLATGAKVLQHVLFCVKGLQHVLRVAACVIYVWNRMHFGIPNARIKVTQNNKCFYSRNIVFVFFSKITTHHNELTYFCCAHSHEDVTCFVLLFLTHAKMFCFNGQWLTVAP